MGKEVMLAELEERVWSSIQLALVLPLCHPKICIFTESFTYSIALFDQDCLGYLHVSCQCFKTQVEFQDFFTFPGVCNKCSTSVDKMAFPCIVIMKHGVIHFFFFG